MKERKGTLYFDDKDRPLILETTRRQDFRKTARIVAVKMFSPFVVNTDRGPMRGQKGDWLVTNHPDDDPGSDLWTISDERMQATYEEVPS